MNQLETLKQWIAESGRIVFFGGAGVSTKHAGFVVNNGGATSADVKNVLAQVAEKVYEAFGICLEPEVRIW